MRDCLASIQMVTDIRPIAKSDNLECARILGWNVVVLKGQFRPGDYGVYFELDSILPDRPWSAFIRPRGFRILSLRLRGQLSQGLFLPFSAFVGSTPEIDGLENYTLVKWLEECDPGDNVTDVLGVTQYENESPAMNFRANFPMFIPKTSETRLQTHPDIMQDLAFKPYVATEKIDGQSSTFLIHPDDGLFHCGSRNLSVIDEPTSPYWNVARQYDIERIVSDNPRLILQGESYGMDLAKNKYKMNVQAFALFDIFHLDRGEYLTYDECQFFADKLGLPVVPLVERGVSFNRTLEDALVWADGMSLVNPKVKREGLVIRSPKNEFSPVLNDRLSTKIISNAWLLNYEGAV